MSLRERWSRAAHSPLAQRLAPEWFKDLYRRARGRVQRAFYDPRRFWTRFGRTYMERFPPSGERSENLFAEHLSTLGAASVLDVGCGYGRYLRALRERTPSLRLAGVDISPTMIERARDFLKDGPDISLHVASATALPVADSSFDAVMTYSMMIHLRPDEVDLFLCEARRVARWGVFLESSANPAEPWRNPPYYFAHEYEDRFRRHGMTVTQRITIREDMREYLYVVRLRPGEGGLPGPGRAESAASRR